MPIMYFFLNRLGFPSKNFKHTYTDQLLSSYHATEKKKS